MKQTQSKRLFAFLMLPTVVTFILSFGLLNLLVLLRGYSILDFVHLGDVWANRNLSGSWGYDGQFYYQLAKDPLHAFHYMDDAPYRYQRIFYPLVAFVLSFGMVGVVPYLLLGLNLLAIVGGVEFLSRLLVKQGLSPWFSLVYGLYFGAGMALCFDTPEPFACGLIILGFWFLQREQIVYGALFFGCAALTRETMVLFPICYVLYFGVRKLWKPAFIFAIVGVLPIMVWLGMITIFFGRTGLGFSPPFERIPFGGVIAHLSSIRRTGLMLIMVVLPTLFSIGMFLWETWKRRWQQEVWWAIWLVNLLQIVFLSRYSYLELVSVGRISLPLLLAGLIYAIAQKNKLMLYGFLIETITFLIMVIGILLHIASFVL